MGHRLVVFLLVAGVLGGCGKEIGDACNFATDCSPNGDRQCDQSSTVDGYCTIGGCDYNTCPSEAECVRFFTGQFSNKPCDPATASTCTPGADGCCSLDELCSLNNLCVARSSEVRFCMRKCGGDGDCRDTFECRDLAKMRRDGGEPVLAPGLAVDDRTPKFCAFAPATP